MKRLIEYIRVSQPTWPEDMVRLAASAINVYRTRLTDIFVRDFVSIPQVEAMPTVQAAQAERYPAGCLCSFGTW